MPSRADVEEFAEANANIRTLATSSVGRLWATLTINPDELIQARDTLLAALPVVVAQFSEVSATVAADHYETAREAAGVTRPYQVVLADVPDAPQVQSATRWALGPLFDNLDKAAALARVVTVVDRLSLASSNETIVRNVQADPSNPRYARVPNGPTCAWCLALASRGAVYASDATAISGRHPKCNCTAEPSWSPDDLPSHYDPDELYAQYARARDAAGSSDLTAITAELRKQQGIA